MAQQAGGWLAVIGAFMLAALLPTTAAADGGTSIATAPQVVYGQQQSGNTATGSKDDRDVYRSFWLANVLAGDELTIDWESVVKETRLALMPVGTTDFTLLDTGTAEYDLLGSNNKSQLTYRAPISGLMPLHFIVEGGGDVYDPGPYSFIATTRHVLFATLTPISNVYRRSVVTGSATLADGTPAPDGLAFHLVAKWHRGREVLRSVTSATTTGGSLAFQLGLPPETARKTVRLSMTRGEDGGYQATKSAPVSVRVARSAPSGPRVKKKCPKGFKKRKVKGKRRCMKTSAPA